METESGVKTVDGELVGKVSNVAIKFNVSDVALATMKQEFSGLEAVTKQGYESVRKAIALCRTSRTGVEKVRKELVADALTWQRKVNSEAKRLTDAIDEIEKPLKSKKQAVDDEAERIATEKREAEAKKLKDRVLAISKYTTDFSLNAISDMTDEAFASHIEELQLAEAAAKAELARIEEEKRLAAEREAKAAEAERLFAEQALAEERARLEAERQAAIAHQKAFAEEMERQQRILAEEQAKADAERQAAFAELEAAKAEILAQQAALDAQRAEAERAAIVEEPAPVEPVAIEPEAPTFVPDCPVFEPEVEIDHTDARALAVNAFADCRGKIAEVMVILDNVQVYSLFARDIVKRLTFIDHDIAEAMERVADEVCSEG